MAEIVTFVRQEQQEGESQDPHEKIVAEFPNGKYYQILLTPEEQHRCTIDLEYLKEVLSKAELEQASEVSNVYEAKEEKKEFKEDSSSGNAAKWSDEKTLLLLTLVMEFCPHTKDKKQRRSAWDAIADIFSQNGYGESALGISKKWFNLKDRYKIIKKKRRSSRSEHTSWPYFEKMDEILAQQGDKISPTDSLLSSMALNIQSISRASSPSVAENSSSTTYESYTERKQRKRKKKQMSGRSKKRRLRGKANDQPVSHAPAWFTAYLKGAKDERKWREEMSNIMRDGNNAVKLLAASIAEFARK